MSCAVLCQIVSLQYLSRSSFNRLADLPYVLVGWSPSGDTRGPSVVFEMGYVLSPGPFHFSHIADYIYDFCPLPVPGGGLSVLVEHTYFHFGPVSRKFVLCWCGDCPGFCIIRPTCHSSLYLLVLIILLDAVVLSQVYVDFNIFFEHIVHVYCRGAV